MGLWLSTTAKHLDFLGSSKPGHGYDMLADKLAAKGEEGSAVAIGIDWATSEHHNSEIDGMASHMRERIRLLYALRDFHNDRVMLETDVADALGVMSGTVGGLHDENKIVQNLLRILWHETRRQADQHSSTAKMWGEEAIKAIDLQIKQSEEFLNKDLYQTLRNSPHFGSVSDKESGPHEQKLDILRGSYQKLEALQVKFIKDYLWNYCDAVGATCVYDNASIGHVKSALNELVIAPRDAITDSEVGPENMQLHAQDPDITVLLHSTINPPPLPQDEGSLGEQTRTLPTVSTEYESDGILFYVKALYDYTATIPDEFNFTAGDIIAVTEVEKTGWWIGHHLESKAVDRRIFPSNYTVVIQL